MTYRVKRLFLDSQEVKYFGTFQTEGEAKMRLAQVLEEAFDEQGIDSSEVRGQIEAAMRNGYHHFREHGKVTSWFMVEVADGGAH